MNMLEWLGEGVGLSRPYMSSGPNQIIYTIKDVRVSRWMGYSVSSEQRTPTDYVYIEVTLPVSGDFVFCDAV